jgi:hypothetical protein
MSVHKNGSKHIPVTKAPDERLSAIFGPVRGIVKLPGVPNNLIEELRDPDWVRSRAWAS